MRCFPASALISPAPTKMAICPSKLPKISLALLTATLETEIGFLDISVLALTVAAHLKAWCIARASF